MRGGRPRRFRIDPDRSHVEVEARSSVHPIHGRASGLRGTVDVLVGSGRLDLSSTPHAVVELAVDELRSGNALYDGEMLRRVEARKYPTIVGELTGVSEVATQAEPEAATRVEAEFDAVGGRYLVTGTLTFHGRTRPVNAEVRAQVSEDGRRLVAQWEQTLDIRDFGVAPPRILVLRVHPEVKVRAHVEAEAEPASADR
jgi:polyisoprenoid-binding protein YceI